MIIDYFSVAQTTVLIGVNLCLTESDLKKQACPEQRRMEPKPAFGRKSEILSSKSETMALNVA